MVPLVLYKFMLRSKKRWEQLQLQSKWLGILKLLREKKLPTIHLLPLVFRIVSIGLRGKAHLNLLRRLHRQEIMFSSELYIKYCGDQIFAISRRLAPERKS